MNEPLNTFPNPPQTSPRGRFLLIGLVLLTVGIAFSAAALLYKQFARPKPKPIEARPEITFRVVEGWGNAEIAKSASKTFGFSETSFNQALSNFQATGFAGAGSKNNLEGYLFPDSYRMYSDSNPQEVISILVETFNLRFQKASSDLVDSGNGYVIADSGITKPFSVDELVTLASIIERETGRNIDPTNQKAVNDLNNERRTVAGIFYNRLRINQALQSDATINYITKKNDPAPLASDLEVKSPYNTYKNTGLPPGPIASPSYSSLYAVLHPIKTPYFYFLHKQPSGEVVYSVTFEEHVRNKNLYLR